MYFLFLLVAQVDIKVLICYDAPLFIVSDSHDGYLFLEI